MNTYEENIKEGKQPFKVFIKIIKSYRPYSNEQSDCVWYKGEEIKIGSQEIIHEKLIYAKDKKEVKKIILEKYPEFFLDGKIFEKESAKNELQIAYVLIYPLYNFEIIELNSGEWECSGCGQIHKNKYEHKPKIFNKLGDNYLFCNSFNDSRDFYNRYNAGEDCLKLFKNKIQGMGAEIPDNLNYAKSGDPIYIYKITEKETGKSYIGKTKNAPFFRWWEHLKHSNSPFGVYLRSTDLSDWTFEVLESLNPLISDDIVFKKESEYILKYDSINNGFNKLISNKEAKMLEDIALEMDIEENKSKNNNE